MGEENDADQPPASPASAERHATLQDLSRRHVQFRTENDILSDHLTRLITRKGSDHLHLQLAALEEDVRETEDGPDARRTSRSSLRLPAEDGVESSGRDSRFGSLRRNSQRGSLKAQPSSSAELVLPLSLEEKCEIAEDECKAVKLQTVRYRDESERILDDIKAVIEETELSIGEIRKEKNSFQREVMFEAELRHSKFASTDRILSYVQEKIKGKHVLIAKLREKNNLLQTHITDTERQLMTKKDLADILHAVDFDQITIQNQQLVSKIRDRIHEFHRLKANSNRALQVKLKELLDIGTQESDGPTPPHALEYMRLKEKSQWIKKEVQIWKKKVEIAELAYSQLEHQVQTIGSLAECNNGK